MSKEIDRKDIKVGDTITVSKTVKVLSVRDGNEGRVVVTPTASSGFKTAFLIADGERVELDKRPELTIPRDALIVTWVADDIRWFASRDRIEDPFVSDGTEVSIMSLPEWITGGEYGEYKSGSFRVLTTAPPVGGLASGGYVFPNAAISLASAAEAFSRVSNPTWASRLSSR